MTIAGRFAHALAAVDDPHLAGAEQLPVRLAWACVGMLPVDGAGLSLRDAGRHRVPLGAAPDEAVLAERLQFTVGTGPCAWAESTREPVFAVEDDLLRRWPVFGGLLHRETPYRAVVALPLDLGFSGSAAIDFFFRRSADVPALDVFEALAVGELVGSALSEAAVWSTWPADRGPDWLHGPTPRARGAVWESVDKVAAELALAPATALALLRARAYVLGVPVDEVAADLLAGRLRAGDLGA
ncbi:hypothetical protein [Candidatus Blastococcus massiliensis]|uniref:hypothetical protein n=1 Tax=Candidatus Blastococcus massiliensis TaxID=1470358 RepID=UPI0004BCB39D|nr:hypothetical protein [Candidatus Blastococcus massiliensis]